MAARLQQDAEHRRREARQALAAEDDAGILAHAQDVNPIVPAKGIDQTDELGQILGAMSSPSLLTRLRSLASPTNAEGAPAGSPPESRCAPQHLLLAPKRSDHDGHFDGVAGVHVVAVERDSADPPGPRLALVVQDEVDAADRGGDHSLFRSR